MGGDAKSLSIAAASILAKTSRDARMAELDGQFPGYGFAQHKGYPVRAHIRALERLGACPFHRRSFAPVRVCLGLPPLPPWPRPTAGDSDERPPAPTPASVAGLRRGCRATSPKTAGRTADIVADFHGSRRTISLVAAMKQSRRIAPRVPYGEAVSVFRTDGSARIYARGIDLSAVGIQLASDESWPIGTDVRCTLLLPGGPRTVGGRIVRVTALPRGVATAIAFSFLSAGAAAAIVQLVEARQRAAQPAKLRVAGMDRPLRCQGRLDEGTVRLTAALPFLKLHGDVEVVIGEDGQAASGVISKIALDPSPTDGVPRLSVEVELATRASRIGGSLGRLPMPSPKLRAPSPRPGPSRDPVAHVPARGAPGPRTTAPAAPASHRRNRPPAPQLRLWLAATACAHPARPSGDERDASRPRARRCQPGARGSLAPLGFPLAVGREATALASLRRPTRQELSLSAARGGTPSAVSDLR